ncbi:hypothetical protein BpHYR1_005425 [Brachionus plicatilis]|uniref:Uncharacterized protein n=1 Tax=Brachionus plicatilis TaxID=10195 RepID=A0A3M7QC02_BRAPC|nr:hypothetical protein BpHYR1_005425 [Brachionus plicatilis]
MSSFKINNSISYVRNNCEQTSKPNRLYNLLTRKLIKILQQSSIYFVALFNLKFKMIIGNFVANEYFKEIIIKNKI